MLASLPFLPTALSVLWTLAGSLRAQEQQSGGYLAAVFKGNVPNVFINLAPASAPSTFTPLNDGNAALVPISGTGGARDPFTFKAQDPSNLIVLATDLDIDKTDWGTAQTNGSRSIFVWDSTDGATWSADRLTFTAPARWNSDESATVIDQEIQHVGGRSYVRYLSDTDVVKCVVLDRSDDELFGT
ncbi:hypothetical protein E8E11_004656 [Didymella keratinophila]|nr:hypothetical protein E8E11_004656 [Didymella keratinophila]